MKKKTNKQSVNIHVPMTMISYSWEGNISLPPNETYVLHVDYPLRKPAKFDIKTGKNGMGVIELINTIGKIYDKMYEVDDKEDLLSDDEDFEGYTYDICGHSIDDLSLSGIDVNHDKKKITISVDS